MIYLIYIWLALFIIIMPPIIKACADAKLGFGWRIVVMIITYVGAPVMLLGQAFSNLLDLILPEGWNDE